MNVKIIAASGNRCHPEPSEGTCYDIAMPSAVSRPHRHRLLLTLSVIFGGILFCVLAWFLWQTIGYYRDIKQGNPSTLKERRLKASISNLVANAHVTPQDLARLVPATGLYPELGSRNARVTVVEFLDYQCPFCQESAPTVRNVMRAMGDRVRLVVRDFPLTQIHPTAKQSALAANCILAQGQERYWRAHDLLYGNIDKQSPKDLHDLAIAAGADPAAFDACVAQDLYGKKIDADIEDGLRAGVEGTPTFFVNGIKIEGALDEQTLIRVLNTVLEQVK
jgi:protein-disulfide isomerase